MIRGARGAVASRTKPLTALAVVLALGACSTAEDTWDWAFGPDDTGTAAETATAPDAGQGAGKDTGTATDRDAEGRRAPAREPADALIGADSPPDYSEGGRRAPRSVRPLKPANDDRSDASGSGTAAGTVAYTIGGSPDAAAQKPAIEREPVPAPAEAKAPQARPEPDTAPQAGVAPADTAPARAPQQASADGSDGLLIEPPAQPADLTVRGAGYPGAGAVAGTTVISSRGVHTEGPSDPVVVAQTASLGGALTTIPSASPGTSSLVATIQFAHGSAALDARDRRILRQVKALAEQNGATVHVVGHASSRTGNMTMAQHKMANFATSVARAEAVVTYLRRLGMPEQAMRFTAVSDDDPAYFEVMPSGEAGNRRAEIYLEF